MPKQQATLIAKKKVKTIAKPFEIVFCLSIVVVFLRLVI
jgi:hypothetical protein